ncbi:voltage-gated potassium channel Kch [bacterium BMS3Bbin06]|nr:voltage-gated potassium channel Kch [bacterium BMS3Abin08]GBE34055.1 voltage-gated potassium channel Kch [bacterium BMS3Bbin06]HDO35324.1 potassium channel protein [Nitrospirota bacterium]
MRKRAIISLALVFVVLLIGTVGFSAIEGWSLFESLYMTVITLSTIGYKEVRPLSDAGKLFTIIFIFFGVGVVAYVINNGIRVVFEGEIQKAFGRRKLEKKLKTMKNHYIVCGYGRMGRIICKELRAKGVPVVVIEKERQELDGDTGHVFIYGDATRDEFLKDAAIERAKGLISVLSTDAQNLYVVLSARGLNPDLLIVARAGDEGSERKLLRAGADRVVSPYYIGGLRIAQTVLKPAVVDFLEFATKSGNLELQLEEIEVSEASAMSDKTIHEAGVGRELGVIIVAIKRKTGEMRFNPVHNTRIKPGDTLIAIGETEKLDMLEEMARNNGK